METEAQTKQEEAQARQPSKTAGAARKILRMLYCMMILPYGPSSKQCKDFDWQKDTHDTHAAHIRHKLTNAKDWMSKAIYTILYAYTAYAVIGSGWKTIGVYDMKTHTVSTRIISWQNQVQNHTKSNYRIK